MEQLNCLRCQYRHEDNGNCTATGGFCTAVPAAHCRLLQEYLDTGLTPEKVLPKDKADEIALKLMRLADLESLCSYTRLRELAEADREGRVAVLPCKMGGTVIDQTFEENPTLMKNIRLEIAYERSCGVIFHIGYGIFADLVEDGRIKPVSEEALRRAEDG